MARVSGSWHHCCFRDGKWHLVINDSCYLCIGEEATVLSSSSGIVVSGNLTTSTGNISVDGHLSTTNLTASGDVKIDGEITNLNNIQFNISPTHTHTEGSIHWDADDKTLNIDTEVNGTAIQVGQEVVLRATNKTGDDISNGQVVYLSGAQGQRPTVYLADSDFEITSHNTIGLATHDIANNATGYITTFGLVRGLNTTGTPVSETWGDGDMLWLSTVSGSMTNTKPSPPQHVIAVGNVLYSHATEGAIFVDVGACGDLSLLHDVSITSPTNNDILQYVAASSSWQNVTGLILSNVTTTTARNALSASNGLVIYNSEDQKFQGYQSGSWINLDDGSAA